MSRPTKPLGQRKCPACNAALTIRYAKDNPDHSRARTYLCSACARKYTSIESAITPALSIVKKNGRIELYRPEKLARSIEAIGHKHAIPAGWPLLMARELVATTNAEEPIESSHGVSIAAAHRIAERDPGLAVRYLAATMDANFADIATIMTWVRDWVVEGRR